MPNYVAPVVLLLGLSALLYKTKDVWSVLDYASTIEGKSVAVELTEAGKTASDLVGKIATEDAAGFQPFQGEDLGMAQSRGWKGGKNIDLSKASPGNR